MYLLTYHFNVWIPHNEPVTEYSFADRQNVTVLLALLAENQINATFCGYAKASDTLNDYQLISF